MDWDFTVGYIVVFGWGLVVLAAFIGWGRVVHRLAGGPLSDAPDWGLHAGWGMVLALVAGGVLSLLEWVSPASLIGFVLVGCGIFAAGLIGDRNRLPGFRAGGVGRVIVLCLIAALAVRYASVVSYQALSCADDDVAYFTFVQRLLQTGTLIEPYSLRRLAGYGGQSFLQALVMAVGAEENAYLMDRGIALIVAAGLTIGIFPRAGTARATDPAAPALALVLIVLLPFPLLNSASHVSGLALFLTLFRTLAMIGDPVRAPSRVFWLLGAVVAGAASLRAHYLAVAALSVLAFWAIQTHRHRHPPIPALSGLLHAAGASVLALAPWMALLWRSSNTPLYPLFRGNHRTEFENYAAPLDLGERLGFVADVFGDPGIALFAAPVILCFFRQNAAGLALYVGALVTTLILAWMFTYSDPLNIHRYVAPFLNAAFVGTVVAFTAETLRELPAGTGRKAGDRLIALSVVVLLPLMASKDIRRLADHWGRQTLSQQERNDYAAIQRALPDGARLFAAVDHPYAFDYRRNTIFNIDVPGAASPDPGFPYFQGADAVKRYLVGQGVSGVIFRDFDFPGGCLYTRRLWDYHAAGEQPAWRMGARYYLDVMKNLETLAARSNAPLRQGYVRGFALK